LTFKDAILLYKLTLAVLRAKVNYTKDSSLAISIASASKISLLTTPSDSSDKLPVTRFFLDGKDVTDEIRSPQVTSSVSAIAIIPEIRGILQEKQRLLALDNGTRKGLVMDGRDIGTQVFPDAELKIFMTADVECRTARRARELRSQGFPIHLQSLRREIEKRDQIDKNRQISPLKRAPGSILLDTTHLTLLEQVDCILEYAYERLRLNK